MPDKDQSSLETYEAAIAELETIVSKMETGNLPLEQSLSSYKRGTELLKTCQKSLINAEQQVSILSNNNTISPLLTEIEESK